jgi:hypothetical protein
MRKAFAQGAPPGAPSLAFAARDKRKTGAPAPAKQQGRFGAPARFFPNIGTPARIFTSLRTPTRINAAATRHGSGAQLPRGHLERGDSIMKMLALAFAAALLPAAASAQTMTCADYLKADKQVRSQMGGMSMSTGNAQMDAQAAALDKKLNDYCAKNPNDGLDKAMMEAMK